jgi:hypothetical protein
MKRLLVLVSLAFVVLPASGQCKNISVATLEKLCVMHVTDSLPWPQNNNYKRVRVDTSYSYHNAIYYSQPGASLCWLVDKVTRQTFAIQYETSNRKCYLELQSECLKVGYMFDKREAFEEENDKTVFDVYSKGTWQLKFNTSDTTDHLGYSIGLIGGE